MSEFLVELTVAETIVAVGDAMKCRIGDRDWTLTFSQQDGKKWLLLYQANWQGGSAVSQNRIFGSGWIQVAAQFTISAVNVKASRLKISAEISAIDKHVDDADELVRQLYRYFEDRFDFSNALLQAQ